MESNSAFQPNKVPNSEVNPSPHDHPVCFHQHPLHCSHQLHYHWVYPPFMCNHAPLPRCSLHSLPFASPPTAISPKTNNCNLPNRCPVQSNATNTVSAKQETHNNDSATATSNASIGCQSVGAKCGCFCVARHMHAPLCPHHYVLPSSCPANADYGQPHLNTMEGFSGHAEGEPTDSYMGAEIWHREGEIQANQDGAMENGYELEEEEEEPVFVLTDEWMEFFAKSEARRQQKKKQQQKEAKKLRKAARSAPKKHDGEVEISDSATHSADPSSSALS